MLMYF